MCSYILDRHVFRHFQGISLKSTGVRKPGISKSQRHLTNTAATKATHPLNAEIEKHILETDGNASKPPPGRSSHDELPASTDWTTKLAHFVAYGESDTSSFISRPDIIVADEAEPVVKKTHGNASPPLIGNLRTISSWAVCPFFST